jgi:hypothetical protein
LKKRREIREEVKSGAPGCEDTNYQKQMRIERHQMEETIEVELV